MDRRFATHGSPAIPVAACAVLQTGQAACHGGLSSLPGVPETLSAEGGQLPFLTVDRGRLLVRQAKAFRNPFGIRHYVRAHASLCKFRVTAPKGLENILVFVPWPFRIGVHFDVKPQIGAHRQTEATALGAELETSTRRTE